MPSTRAGTIAIVGAGPQLGLAVARRFATEGYDVALLARSRPTLEAMRDELTELGVRAEALVVDLRDRDGLVAALDRAEAALGPIDVVEFSPAPSPADLSERPFFAATDVTVESVLPELETWTLSAVAAIGHLLPGMIRRDTGTVLVTTGAGSGPMIVPVVANVQIATAGLRNWTLNLHAALGGTGVYAAHVAIAAEINAPGQPDMAADVIADAYWQLHTTRDVGELVYPGLPAQDEPVTLAAKNQAGLDPSDA